MLKKTLKNILLIIFVIMIGATGGVIYQKMTENQTGFESSVFNEGGLFTSGPKLDQSEDTNPETTAILLMGIDTGDLGRSDQGRSDVMMLATLNSATNHITITSIPRDVLVNIPGQGEDKINHAYAFGGPRLAAETLNDWLGITVNHYLAVNMAGLKEIVDALGGIEVIPPSSFFITIEDGNSYSFSAGVPTHLDGDSALAYARERQTSGGDYARQDRQRQIVIAGIDKLKSIGAVTKLPGLYSSISNNLQTDMGLSDFLSLAKVYRQASENIETFQLEGYGQMINGVYYDIPDSDSLEQLRVRLKKELD